MNEKSLRPVLAYSGPQVLPGLADDGGRAPVPTGLLGDAGGTMATDDTLGLGAGRMGHDGVWLF